MDPMQVLLLAETSFIAIGSETCRLEIPKSREWGES